MIATFYSFKGGVGRSMALANVAQWLSSEGARVVMIDWDLEAPGLETYFCDEQQRDEVRRSPGLMDLLNQYRQYFREALAGGLTLERGTAPRTAESNREAACEKACARLGSLDGFLYTLSGPSSPGALYIMSAGMRVQQETKRIPTLQEKEKELGRALTAEEYFSFMEQTAPADSPAETPVRSFSDYAAAVQDFDWDDFLGTYHGERFFEWLRVQLAPEPAEETQSACTARADIVLIDSRTGVTEMSGICTRLMADLVVSFCAPNQQNLDGVIDMGQSFRRPDVLEKRDGKPELMLVPSRVEDRAEASDFFDFQALFERRERQFPTHVFRFPTEELHQNPQTLSQPASPPPKYSFWPLRIPYFAKLSYREALSFPSDNPRARVVPLPEMQTRYKQLAAYIVLHAPEVSALRHKLASALAREVPGQLDFLVVSYEQADRLQGEQLRASLESAGMLLLRDIDHRDDSTPQQDAARGLIHQAKALVVLLTLNSEPSAALRREIRYARQNGKCIFVVRSGAVATNWNGFAASYDWQTDWAKLLADLQRPCAALRCPNMAPPVPDYYVRRAEEEERLRALLAAGNDVRQIAVWGQTGFGKTSLAASVCRDDELIDAFPGGILWVKLGRNPDLLGELTKVYQALTGEKTAFASEEAARAKCAERLSGRRFLLVADEVWSERHLDSLALGTGPQVRLVLTPDRSIASPSSETIALGRLSDVESQRLMTRGLPDVPVDWNSLSQPMYGWPLLIARARARLQTDLSRGIPVGQAVLDAKGRLERHGILAFDEGGGPATISSAISAMLAGLELAESDLLVAIAQDASPETLEKTPDFQKTIERLGNLGLVERTPSAGYRVDDLIASYLRMQGLLKWERPPFISGENAKTNEDVRWVQDALNNRKTTDSWKDMKERVKRLKTARYFGLARRYLALVRRDAALASDDSRKSWLAQQHALCTYKDQDLPFESRLERALKILDQADALAATVDQETLGIAGAIHKAKWLLDGQLGHLETSLAYYKRGNKLGVEKDYGYTSINAAYVSELLASEGESESDVARSRRAEARAIRQDIVLKLPPLLDQSDKAWLRQEWWFFATIAEACFGLGAGEGGAPDEARYEQARYWLREGLALAVSDWEYQSTMRQIVDVARVQKVDRDPASPAMRTLRILMGNDIAALANLQRGKVGLALSGGGFRASFFHIGVLARLAELDMLRHVEVLSCVSGGSILGAHYYLEVRRHLKNHNDMTREDAIEIVKNLERDFLAGVQRDIRNRLLASWGAAVRSACMRGFTQTNKLADLYDRELYSKVQDGEGAKPRLLNGLIIKPPDASPDFAPKIDNWRRSTKIPILILNATTLNTGHNWQFTASWMGESPASINSEIDANERLRRMYYWEAPERYKTFRLADAVAASAAVPMLFDPLELPELYPGRQIRLSDGGVHDNQGVSGLLEQDCSVLLISDASGQMGSLPDPKAGHIGVLWRANEVLQERIRWAEFSDMLARQRGGVLRGLMFVHLKKDLDTEPVNWTGKTDKQDLPDDPQARISSDKDTELTGYGVVKRTQRLIAGIRTDLDAFTEEEAYSLMLSGYRMVNKEFPGCITGFPTRRETVPWEFQKADPLLDDANAKLRILPHAHNVMGKIWRVSPLLKLAAWAFGLAIAAELAWWLAPMAGAFSMSALLTGLSRIALGLAAGGVIFALALGALRLMRIRKAPSQLALSMLLATVGWFVAALHVMLITPLYLEKGRLSGSRRRGPAWRMTGALVLLAAILFACGVWLHAVRGNPFSGVFLLR